MTFESNHTAGGSDGSPDRGQILVIVLVALAAIASVVMLLTDSNGALKLALLAALWAAVIGVFLIARYRAQARQAEQELELREQLHQTQLREAQLEKQQAEGQALERSGGDPDHSLNMEILQEIQRELAAVRAQLEELSGRDFGIEPAALRAEARRIMEIEAQAYSADQDFGDSEDTEDAPAVPPESGPLTPGAGGVSGAPTEDAVAGRLGSQPSRPVPLNPLAALITENSQKSSEEPEPEASSSASHRAPEAEDEDDEAGGGRRRADERDGSVSVAELMANLTKDRKKDKKKDKKK